MAYIKEYWTEKEKRAAQAKEHVKKMQEMHGDEILQSIMHTTIYDTSFLLDRKSEKVNTEIIIVDADTVKAASQYSDGKTALLNFSSYKNPGGMFLKGSKAQEECLCHASTLYNVLSQFENSFYEWNRKNLNRSLYLNRGLYSPNIVFQYNGEEFYCDVITCAAPNKSAAQEYKGVEDRDNTILLRMRIRYILDIAMENKVDTLILGAYGCGVFGQNPEEVASIFKECLNTKHSNCFSKVVFAIPKGKDGNLEAFQKILKQ